VIRLFKVYYPLRTRFCWRVRPSSFGFRSSWVRCCGTRIAGCCSMSKADTQILAVTGAVLLLSHWFDLYDSSSLSKNWEQSLRILLVLGFVALALSAIGFCFPNFCRGMVRLCRTRHPDLHSFLLAWGLRLVGETALPAGAVYVLARENARNGW